MSYNDLTENVTSDKTVLQLDYGSCHSSRTRPTAFAIRIVSHHSSGCSTHSIFASQHELLPCQLSVQITFQCQVS